MKKLAIWVLGMAVVGFVVLPPGVSAHEDDLKVIKKAVRESPPTPSGNEAKWFKLLVVDNETNKESIKIAVPLALVEMVMGCAQKEHARTPGGECDLDLEALLKQLKSAGPMTMLEINENGKTVKVWLE